MKKHFNLYYLFLEDKLRRPMQEERHKAIRRALEAFYEAMRPPTTKRIQLSENDR